MTVNVLKVKNGVMSTPIVQTVKTKKIVTVTKTRTQPNQNRQFNQNTRMTLKILDTTKKSKAIGILKSQLNRFPTLSQRVSVTFFGWQKLKRIRKPRQWRNSFKANKMLLIHFIKFIKAFFHTSNCLQAYPSNVHFRCIQDFWPSSNGSFF